MKTQNKKEEVTEKKVTKSSMIRKLHREGKKIKEIAETLGIRYQHAHNVIVNDENNRLLLEYKQSMKK